LIVYYYIFISLSDFFLLYFFFTYTATTEIYTLSLHDALPISRILFMRPFCLSPEPNARMKASRSTSSASSNRIADAFMRAFGSRSEEHTSELQSQSNLVCRLLLEKKKKKKIKKTYIIECIKPN